MNLIFESRVLLGEWGFVVGNSVSNWIGRLIGNCKALLMGPHATLLPPRYNGITHLETFYSQARAPHFSGPSESFALDSPRFHTYRSSPNGAYPMKMVMVSIFAGAFLISTAIVPWLRNPRLRLPPNRLNC